jgi:uncharacterized protein DUF3368
MLERDRQALNAAQMALQLTPDDREAASILGWCLVRAERHDEVIDLCGFTCLRTPDLVLVMKVQGLIPQVRPVLNRMTQRGYGIASGVYAATLQAAGE